MAASGYTPIQLYYSATTTNTPLAANLAAGELAINTADGKLFYKDSGGTVQVLATKGAGTIGGSNTQVQYNSSGALAGSSNLTFDGTTLTANALTTTSTVTVNGGTANGVTYLNGSKVLTSGSALQFDGNYLGVGGSASYPIEVKKDASSSTASSIYVNPTTGTNAAIVGFNNSGSGGLLVGRSNSAGTGSGATLTAYDSFVSTTGTTGIAFNTNSTNAMYVTSGQRVGIGTTTPDDKLTLAAGSGVAVAVTFWANGNSTSNELYVGQGGSNEGYLYNRANAPVIFGTNGSDRGRFSATGGFSVGTNADPGAGAIYATGNITAYYSSDIKFKENVRDIPNALSTVNAIGGKLFDWTDEYIESKGGADGYFVQKADFGVVAQDVQRVFPIAVRTRPDGSLAVDYEKLSALAFAALVEVTKRLEALEAK